ncbi:MAG: hypothetical protein LBN26_05395 [Christensenellaceae bacterium]|jgi:hypothetical protein|nr:hypothetical protein [Christensenellaceae bacterium]
MENNSALDAALSCLHAICADEEARDADRIAAAKLLLEHAGGGDAPGSLTIVMEGIPSEYVV